MQGTKEYMDLIQIMLFFFNLGLGYFCSFTFKSTLGKIYYLLKKCLSLFSSQIQKS